MQRLKEIYDENINWLNFAELKNGALLAISGLFLQVIMDDVNILWMKIVLVCLCSVIIILTSVSFIPFLNSNKRIRCLAKKYYMRKNRDSLDSQNIVFYVNIFLSTEKKYMQAVKQIVNMENEFSSIENNYIKQIMAISTIASIKYFIFGVAMRLFLINLTIFLPLSLLGSSVIVTPCL